ncbi:ATP-NAD kinase [Sulfolobus sp. B1]|uniref:NAD(+)/NADH kinase n=1 Tax=Sulfolobaceae TaxID=118883 RepID=UPI000845F5B1|nr:MULTISPECIES: NAD(+)/NADH kinase [unclassified Sulfolobus]TRM76685.1 ATP-NAD kinase [Sulfolobus sp. B5]TRM81570.1 ATP-NAD kinase [Sulfolobus sp. D5]TRM84663.1 ATP-NAD kinase [Sulfolobus sp. F3]TRM87516.1 ATP-NAD kinase [Sulfolobus sp. C3]TRM99570.1 ATP-NAD kinase [Sulfolobus sp. F1]TRN04633.1 ATP-NAD kinase [Sulfolobus sp. E1]
MNSIGVIINPESGKDIRRIVSNASYISSYAKINAVKRFLLGLDSTDSVDEVLLMPDFYGLSLDLIEETEDKVNFKLTKVNMKPENTVNDTITASKIMKEKGVKTIVSAGGDGTLRAVFKGIGDTTPILGLSLGTNNVLGASYEPTVLGVMLGYFLKGNYYDILDKAKTIKVLINNEEKDFALVDLTFIDGWYVGAKAIWDEYSLRYTFISKGELGDIGIPSIASFLKPINFDDDFSLMIKFGIGHSKINAILAPGLIKEVFISEVRTLRIGEEIEIPRGNYVIAFDGERDLVANQSQEVKVRVERDGPLLINPQKGIRYITTYYKENRGKEIG